MKIFIFFFLLMTMAVSSQKCFGQHNLEVSLAFGRCQYFGDVKGDALYWSSGRNFLGQIAIRKHLNPYFSLKASLGASEISGSDLDEPKGYWNYRMVSFRSQILEVGAFGELYAFGSGQFVEPCNFLERFHPYITAGLGYVHISPILYVDPEAKFPPNQRLIDRDRQEFGRSALALPFGVGMKVNASRQVGFAFEAIYRYTNTDYLDGFSAAGNPSSFDSLLTVSLSASFLF